MTIIDFQRPTLRVREAAILLGIAHETAYEAIRRGELKAIKLCRRGVVPTGEVEKLLGSPLSPEKLEWAKNEVDARRTARKAASRT